MLGSYAISYAIIFVDAVVAATCAILFLYHEEKLVFEDLIMVIGLFIGANVFISASGLDLYLSATLRAL